VVLVLVDVDDDVISGCDDVTVEPVQSYTDIATYFVSLLHVCY